MPPYSRQLALLLHEALFYVVMVPSLALLAWPPVAALTWLARRRGPWVAELRPRPPARWRAGAVGVSIAFTALAACFGFGFVAASDRAAELGGGDIIDGPPVATRLLEWAPPVLTVLAVALVVAAVVGWRGRWWSLPGRLIYTVIAIDAVLFVALLVRWGYFPLATG
jgi:hypothetical protein